MSIYWVFKILKQQLWDVLYKITLSLEQLVPICCKATAFCHPPGIQQLLQAHNLVWYKAKCSICFSCQILFLFPVYILNEQCIREAKGLLCGKRHHTVLHLGSIGTAVPSYVTAPSYLPLKCADVPAGFCITVKASCKVLALWYNQTYPDRFSHMLQNAVCKWC